MDFSNMDPPIADIEDILHDHASDPRLSLTSSSQLPRIHASIQQAPVPAFGQAHHNYSYTQPIPQVSPHTLTPTNNIGYQNLSNFAFAYPHTHPLENQTSHHPTFQQPSFDTKISQQPRHFASRQPPSILGINSQFQCLPNLASGHFPNDRSANSSRVEPYSEKPLWNCGVEQARSRGQHDSSVRSFTDDAPIDSATLQRDVRRSRWPFFDNRHRTGNPTSAGLRGPTASRGFAERDVEHINLVSASPSPTAPSLQPANTPTVPSTFPLHPSTLSFNPTASNLPVSQTRDLTAVRYQPLLVPMMEPLKPIAKEDGSTGSGPPVQDPTHTGSEAIRSFNDSIAPMRHGPDWGIPYPKNRGSILTIQRNTAGVRQRYASIPNTVLNNSAEMIHHRIGDQPSMSMNGSKTLSQPSLGQSYPRLGVDNSSVIISRSRPLPNPEGYQSDAIMTYIPIGTTVQPGLNSTGIASHVSNQSDVIVTSDRHGINIQQRFNHNGMTNDGIAQSDVDMTDKQHETTMQPPPSLTGTSSSNRSDLSDQTPPRKRRRITDSDQLSINTNPAPPQFGVSTRSFETNCWSNLGFQTRNDYDLWLAGPLFCQYFKGYRTPCWPSRAWFIEQGVAYCTHKTVYYPLRKIGDPYPDGQIVNGMRVPPKRWEMAQFHPFVWNVVFDNEHEPGGIFVGREDICQSTKEHLVWTALLDLARSAREMDGQLRYEAWQRGQFTGD